MILYIIPVISNNKTKENINAIIKKQSKANYIQPYKQGMSTDHWICQHKILENIQNLLTDTLNSLFSLMLYI